MNYPLTSFALVVVAGLCLIAYLFGFEAGRKAGQGEGHEKGKKEGAVRAFAVGYDRGKRERDDDDEEDTEESKPETPSLFVFLFLVITTVMLLSVYAVLRQRGLF